MPPNTVYVGRPSKWGNQVDYHVVGRKTAIDYYKLTISKMFNSDHIKKELRGKNLCCWCGLGEPCHADILLKIANE
jgi:hypothetical protein